jgi:hypothetical protein
MLRSWVRGNSEYCAGLWQRVCVGHMAKGLHPQPTCPRVLLASNSLVWLKSHHCKGRRVGAPGCRQSSHPGTSGKGQQGCACTAHHPGPHRHDEGPTLKGSDASKGGPQDHRRSARSGIVRQRITGRRLPAPRAACPSLSCVSPAWPAARPGSFCAAARASAIADATRRSTSARWTLRSAWCAARPSTWTPSHGPLSLPCVIALDTLPLRHELTMEPASEIAIWLGAWAR